jgi:hypothetical protein
MQAIPTVQITVEPEETNQARVPRALVPQGHKTGCTLGPPELHKRILLDALDLLAHPVAPGELVTRLYTSTP